MNDEKIALDFILSKVQEAQAKITASEAKHLVKDKRTTRQCLLREGKIYVPKQAQ